MERALTLYQTTVGKKAVMAVSGLVLFGFVIGHLVGNLQLYQGPAAINEYAALLRRNAGPVWIARLVLLASVGAHIWSSFQLASRNNAARTSRYKQKRDLVTNYAAKTMVLSGPILLLFLLYHLAHLTFGLTTGAYEFNSHDVYNNVVYGFQVWWIAAVYIVGNLALGLHLYHGAWSMFQSVGLSHPRYDRLKEMAAIGLTAFIVVGNISFPIMVMAGVVEPASPYISFE